MNCEQIAHNLDAYVRGETPTDLTEEIAHHLESCAACREEEAIARKVAGGLRAMRRAAPAGLAERVLSNAPAPRKVGWFTPVRALAATFLVVAALALTKEGRHYFTDEGFREMTVPAPETQTKDLAPPPPRALPFPVSPEAPVGGAGIAEERAEAEPAAPAPRAPRSSLGTSRRSSLERSSAGRVIAPASPEPAPQSGYLKSAPPAAVDATAPAGGAMNGSPSRERQDAASSRGGSPSPRPAASMTAPSPVSSSASSAEVVATDDISSEEAGAMNELRMLRSDEDAAYRYRTRSAEPDAAGAAASATSDSSAGSDSAPSPLAEVTDSTATDSPARR